jgi:hypothetical protein
MTHRKTKLKFKPADQYYAIVLLGDKPGCCCEMASYLRWDSALSRLAEARRGGWDAHIVKVTRTGLIERGELERLRTRRA